MKLLKEEFENYAQEQGYESAEELFDYLGGNVNAYRRYKKQVPISKETFTHSRKFVGKLACRMPRTLLNSSPMNKRDTEK